MNERFEYEGEVFIREIEVTLRNQAAFDPIPSQWTVSQHEDRSPPFPSLTRKERIQQERDNGSDSPRSESDDSYSQGNDFAILEELLEGHDTGRSTHTNTDNIVTGNKDESTKGSTAVTERDDSQSKQVAEEQNSFSAAAYDHGKHPSPIREATCPPEVAKHRTNEPSQLHGNSSNAISSLANTNSRRLSRKVPAAMVSSLLDGTSLNHNSLLEKSRTMAKTKNNKRQTTKIMEDLQSHSTNVTSIVGSRPTHWDQRDSLTRSNKRRLTSLDTNSKKNRAAVLSTFTQPSFHDRRVVPSSRQHLSPFARQPVPNFTATHDPIVDDALEQQTTTKTALGSFAPHFVSLPSSPPPNSTTNALVSPSLPSPQMYSKNSKSMVSGRLSKRLQSIRNSVRGDKIRFQSGQYPFSSLSLDMNDPRNRATSVLDVTVIEASGIRHRDSQRVLLLSFVHNATGPSQVTLSQYCWICFASDTARELTIDKGSRLRVYNTVPVELSVSLDKRFPTVKWAILATTLCELYPNELLPQLADVPTILSQYGDPSLNLL